MEADFARFYNSDLEAAVRHLDARKLYGRVKHLPPDAALWRVQEPEPKEAVVRTADPNEIREFLAKANIG